jgi:hypothetical protein
MSRLKRDEHTVTVYSFRLLDGPIESLRVESYKATRRAILALGGEPLEGTEQEVPPSALDANGHYRRVNTGWGALD